MLNFTILLADSWHGNLPCLFPFNYFNAGKMPKFNLDKVRNKGI